MFSLIPFQPGKRMVVAMLLAGFSTLGHSLTFDEALRLAQADAPQLKAREEDAAAAQSNSLPAGELPDPKLELGIDNLPISGPDRYSVSRDFMTMRRIGVMQEFPNGAKREARIAVAQSKVAVAEAQTRITRLTVLREAAIAWIARASVEQALVRMDDLRAENRLLDSAVKAMLAGGKGTPTDAVMPRQEAALIEDRADELRTRREQAIAALKRWIGAAAEEPLQGTSPDWPISHDVLAHSLHRHPELTGFDSQERMLDAEIGEAQAEKRPDWALELAYQQRGPQFSDMVSLQMSFDLPIFPGSRQDPKIAAKRAERAGLDAEREATLREHAAMLESDLAEHQRLANTVKRQREVLLPLADEKVELAMAAWCGGKGSLAEVIAARRERIDTELKVIELEGQRRQVAARLYYAYGDHPGEQQ
ncbi:TolC family protein [Thiobacillus thioparus]|uniref:TolC family protein n=1 Tax=Thiobacillus thioparus TaxID=931 RepID=UPI0012F975F9|nr:TolC family protein [Thiobacillus thioparus]MBS0328708.1 TolC family protein [Pseudomonadota bacterium]